jgi:putative restriction endonuclease
MVKAIFIASSHSAWADRPGEVYHFPNVYLNRVAQTVGDWVIFFEGKRGGSRGYYAVQRVERIVPDPANPKNSFAILDRGSELGFEQNVPRLKTDGKPWETGLPLQRGSNTSAVRLISNQDFAAIVAEGLRADIGPDALPRRPAPQSSRNSIFMMCCPVFRIKRRPSRCLTRHNSERELWSSGRCANSPLPDK